MRYYPINLDVQKKKCLVVGGGSVGTRKVIILLGCGADITVVSLDFTKKLRELSLKGLINLKRHPFETVDLFDIFLVIGATDNEELNRRISAEAQRLNILCNIADRPAVSNFILPAIVSRGDLIIAISTCGKSPAFAKKLRKELKKQFGEEYAKFLCLMGAIRSKMLSQEGELQSRKQLFEELVGGEIVEMIKNDRQEEINTLLFEILGKGYDFNALMKNQ